MHSVFDIGDVPKYRVSKICKMPGNGGVTWVWVYTLYEEHLIIDLSCGLLRE